MNHYPEKVKEKLNSIIYEMAERHWMFSSNPGHDFMRQNTGKLSFSDTMRLIVYTDQTEHTARRFSAWLPPIQCTLSGHQCMMLIQG